MCRTNVAPDSAALLGELLHDIAAALDPDDPTSVVIGPVDFGPDEQYTLDNPPPWINRHRHG